MKLKDTIEDLEYLIEKIKNVHISTFNGLDEEQVKIMEVARNNLYEDMPEEEFVFIANGVMNSLSDSHSRLEINFSEGDKYIDVQALWLKEGIFVCEGGPYLEKGDKILGIGGQNIDYIFNELKKIIPHENEYIVKAKAFNNYNKMSFLFSELILKHLKLIEDEKVVFKIERRKEIIDISCNFKEYVVHKESETWIAYSISKESNIGIFKLDQCIFNEEYKLKLRSFFSEIHNSRIGKLVVDLRNNMGGDSRVAYEFLKYLNIESYKDYRIDERISKDLIEVYRNLFNKEDLKEGYAEAKEGENVVKIKKDEEIKEKFKGELYILTSNTTFSSARTFAVLIKDNGLGTIVGEPTGGKPSSYGNVVRFKMPNSKMKFSLSTNRFIRPNGNIHEDSLYPDATVNTTREHIIKGEDPQIQWLL